MLSDVDSETEHTSLSASDSGPVIRSSPVRTSSCCPATKYGPAWPTSARRSSVIENEAITRSTVPLCRNGTRSLDTVCTQWMSLIPSRFAISLAISMSKPSTLPVTRLRKPTPGWSVFTPTVIDPAACNRAIAVPAGNATGSGSEQPVTTPTSSASTTSSRSGLILGPPQG